MQAKCCTNKKLTVEYSNLAKFLKIISDDNRLRILCLLKEGEKGFKCKNMREKAEIHCDSPVYTKGSADCRMWIIRRSWNSRRYLASIDLRMAKSSSRN